MGSGHVSDEPLMGIAVISTEGSGSAATTAMTEGASVQATSGLTDD